MHFNMQRLAICTALLVIAHGFSNGGMASKCTVTIVLGFRICQETIRLQGMLLGRSWHGSKAFLGPSSSGLNPSPPPHVRTCHFAADGFPLCITLHPAMCLGG